MTLCIAAISRCPLDPYPRIVIASDLMLSSETGDMSRDTQALKLAVSPTGRWIAMYSGSPTAWGMVSGPAMRALKDGQETLADVRSAFEVAFQNELTSRIEGAVLSPYAMRLSEWTHEGFGRFGPAEFARINSKIEKMRLDITIVVAGFEPDHWPRIFSISGRGERESHESYGFVTVGVGATLAEASLTGWYDEELGSVDLTYHVCEAKFLGEDALGVGKKTCVVILSPLGTPHDMLAPEQVEPIRAAWKEDRARPIPVAAVDAILKADKKNWASDYSKRPLLAGITPPPAVQPAPADTQCPLPSKGDS